MTRPLIAIVLTAFACACAAPERKDPGLMQTAPKPTRPSQTQAWMQSRDYAVDAVPDMDRSRRVNEQDCTKPIDLAAGNLRCR
jgi:hypothetical protein